MNEETTLSDLERLAQTTEQVYAKAKELDLLCHCGCGCDYYLPTEYAQDVQRTGRRCFSCRHGIHFGSMPR